MAKSSQRAALKKQMEALQAQLAEVSVKEESKAGKLARKSGLLDLDLSDAELLEGFRELTAKFRNGPITKEPETNGSPAS